jgi:hypothetical protein
MQSHSFELITLIPLDKEQYFIGEKVIDNNYLFP